MKKVRFRADNGRKAGRCKPTAILVKTWVDESGLFPVRWKIWRIFDGSGRVIESFQSEFVFDLFLTPPQPTRRPNKSRWLLKGLKRC